MLHLQLLKSSDRSKIIYFQSKDPRGLTLNLPYLVSFEYLERSISSSFMHQSYSLFSFHIRIKRLLSKTVIRTNFLTLNCTVYILNEKHISMDSRGVFLATGHIYITTIEQNRRDNEGSPIRMHGACRNRGPRPKTIESNGPRRTRAWNNRGWVEWVGDREGGTDPEGPEK